MNSKTVICFGEVLWDVLPAQRIAGGAPMNVAIRLQSLGINSKMISRTGNDGPGNELRSVLKSKNVDTSLVQTDEQLLTGEVLVQLDTQGIATYDIVYPSAWDKIQLTNENLLAVKQADAFVFGSLACRDEASKHTLHSLLELAAFKVFDVNLRPPFVDLASIEFLMQQSGFIKLNDEELLIVAKAFGSLSNEIEENVRFLSTKTNTNTICITKGKDGATLFVNNQFYSNNGYEVKVEDTIGAGDSFLAALLSQMLVSNDYHKALAYACAVGALVASKKGANPDIKAEEIADLLKQQDV